MEGTEDFSQSLVGGSVANALLVLGFVLFKYFQQRCKKSKCSSHNQCWDCTTEMDELKSTSLTVRDINHKQLALLEHMVLRINAIENRSRTETEEGEMI